MPELSSLPLGTDANLQGYWKLETSGVDETANNNDLTATGGPTHVAGNFGNAVDLELSSSQYYSIAHASQTGLSQTGNQSASVWINQESQGANQAIVSKRNAADDGWVLYVRDSGQPTIRMDFSGGVVNLSSEIMTTGVWHHVAFTFDGTTVKIFLDNVGTSTTPSGALSTTTTPFAIGCDFSGASDTAALFFDGVVDDVAYFDRTLSDGEIDSIFQIGAGGINSYKSLLGVGR